MPWSSLFYSSTAFVNLDVHHNPVHASDHNPDKYISTIQIYLTIIDYFLIWKVKPQEIRIPVPVGGWDRDHVEWDGTTITGPSGWHNHSSDHDVVHTEAWGKINPKKEVDMSEASRTKDVMKSGSYDPDWDVNLKDLATFKDRSQKWQVETRDEDDMNTEVAFHNRGRFRLPGKQLRMYPGEVVTTGVRNNYPEGPPLREYKFDQNDTHFGQPLMMGLMRMNRQVLDSTVKYGDWTHSTGMGKLKGYHHGHSYGGHK